MANSFESAAGPSESYKDLINLKQMQAKQVLASCKEKNAEGEMASASASLKELDRNDETLTGLTTSDSVASASFSFSGLDVEAAEQNPFSSPHPEFEFDSKDFMSGDSSAIKKQLDKDHVAVVSAAKNEAIPSPHRIDLNEFSGFMGDGEVDTRPSWVSPEKRNLPPRRLSIGQYFSLKSSNMKELCRDLCSDKAKMGLKSSNISGNKSHHSPLPTGPRPEFMSGKSASETIDLTNERKENPEATIQLDDSVVSGCSDVADTSVQWVDMDVTLVPGQESIMSLSTIASMLNNTKGSDTVVGELLEAAQRPMHISLRSSKHKNMKKTPPTESNSRGTFLIPPSQDNKSSSPRTPSRIPKPSKGTENKNSNTFLSPATSQSNPSNSKKTNTGRKKNLKPLNSKQSSSPTKLAGKNSMLEREVSKQSPVTAQTTLSKPMVSLPLNVKGAEHGVTDLEMLLSVPVTNVITVPISCTIVNTAHSRHLEMKPATSLIVGPGSSAILNVTVTALISGEHVVKLEVKVCGADGTGDNQAHSVAPHMLTIEAPKVTIVKQYSDYIDFGLRPEDSRKILIINVKNLGFCSLPVCITLVQGTEGPCFFLLVPPDENEEDLQLAGSITFELPGSGQAEEPCTQDIGLIFFAPRMDNMRANLLGSDQVTLEAKLTVTLKNSGGRGASQALAGARCLEQCVVRGEVGRTQLLVSHTDLALYAGTPQNLGMRNGGIVPLDLKLRGMLMPGQGTEEEIEPAISVQPSSVLLLPGEEANVTMTWNPNSGETNAFNRELHLMYDGLAVDSIVSLKCYPNDAQQTKRYSFASLASSSGSLFVTKAHLPLRSTRLQLAWGSLGSGCTVHQLVSYKNTSNQPLHLHISIQSMVHTKEPPPFQLLSDAKEVTRSLELQLRPGQEQRLAVMFCPLRLGPASANLRLSSVDPNLYATKQVLLTGYGGFSNVVLRKVASAQGLSWLILNPGLGDHVDGSFSVTNLGTLPAFVHITSAFALNSGCSLLVKPDTMIVPARGSETVTVRLSGISAILSKAHSGEVKTLTSLNVFWINEVTRRRLRKLLPGLSNSDQASIQRVEQAVTVIKLVKMHVEGEEKLVSQAELAALQDHSGASAVSLSKDMVCTKVELRAVGTGVNNSSSLEADTVSSFVTLMDCTVIPKTSNDRSSVDVVTDTCAATATHSEWSVAPRDVVLHAGNTFSTAVQVCNLSASVRLCLDIEARDELTVTPTVVEVLPCETVSLELRLTRPPLHSAHWPAAVKVFTANDVMEISVKVLPMLTGRMSKHKAVGNNLMISALRSTMNSQPRQEWLTPSKMGGTPANRGGTPCSAFPGFQSVIQFPGKPRAGIPTSSSSSSLVIAKSSVPITGVYLDTNTINFPWTHIGLCSSSKLTLYNDSNFDKKVSVSSVPSPFSVDPSDFEVAGHWHKAVTVKFSPHTPGACCETLRFSVEGQPELICTFLRGHALLS